MADSPIPLDPFARFRAATRARIGLGRSGDAMPLRPLLDFQLAHAQARDAVHGRVDWDRVAEALPPGPVLSVHSAASDRQTYLRRPDLGRRLDESSALGLSDGGWDLALVVADGLSAAAVQSWAAPTIAAILDRLPDWRIAPVVFASQARVAIGDPIGEKLGAQLVAVLIGERPGLSAADSLGIYLTYAPRSGRRDSERNCISNIHGGGLSPQQAADKLVWLARQARHLRLTGVDLKEDARSAESIEAGAPRLDLDAEPFAR